MGSIKWTKTLKKKNTFKLNTKQPVKIICDFLAINRGVYLNNKSKRMITSQNSPPTGSTDSNSRPALPPFDDDESLMKTSARRSCVRPAVRVDASTAACLSAADKL
jgi:hypothetical protein